MTNTAVARPTVADLVLKSKDQFAKALPRHFDTDKFLRIAMTCLRKNEKLSQCDSTSLMAALMQAAQLGLSPDPLTGQAYLIPRQRSINTGGQWQKVWECNFQIGAKGARVLVMNTGEVQSINILPVYEEDKIQETYRFGEGGIVFEPAMDGAREVLKGVYCLVRFKNGMAPLERYIRIAEIYKRRANSDAYQYAAKCYEEYQALPEDKRSTKEALRLLSNYQDTPWVKWEAEMVEKTALKMICGDLPIDVERLAFLQDNLSKEDKPTIDADYAVQIMPQAITNDAATILPATLPEASEDVKNNLPPASMDPLAELEAA